MISLRAGFIPTPSLATLAAFAALLAAACGRAGEPRVERWQGGAFESVGVAAHEINGRRDGAATAVSVVLSLEGGERLRMELTIAYNPTPALGSGTWRVEGDGGAAGEVRAESIRFLGGQGEGPSVGGRFRLEDDGEPHYRVTLPARPIDAPGGRG